MIAFARGGGGGRTRYMILIAVAGIVELSAM